MQHAGKPGFLIVLPWALEYVGGVNQVVENILRQVESGVAYRPLLMVMEEEGVEVSGARIGPWDTIRHELRSPVGNAGLLRQLSGFISGFPFALFYLRRLVAKRNIRVINVHYPTLSALHYAALKRMGLYDGKLIISVHGSDVRGMRQSSGFQRRLWSMLLRAGDAIVACSGSLADELKDVVPECREKIKVIHNGVDVDHVLAERDKDFSLPLHLRNRRFVLNVAAFREHKGQDVLLRAFSKVASRLADVSLVLIGGGGQAKESLVSLIDELSLQDRVFLHEDMPHARISAFFEKASLFVFPSKYEPFGIVMLEAGLFAVPVIASNVGGIPEVISHGQTGCLIHPDDEERFAVKMIELLENPEEARRLGVNLRARVLEDFTWKQAYQKYLLLL